jgi:hypothetical protein
MNLHKLITAPLILVNLIGCSSSVNEWKILFDGKNTDQWKGFNKDYFPDDNWKIENNSLKTVPGLKNTVDIITKEKYQNFELELEWKVSKEGNSGIFYFASESQNYIWQSAPEMQVLDNDNHPDGKDPLTSAGSLFALIAPTNGKPNSIGKFNRSKIKVLKYKVEHWLNGVKIVEYIYQSDAMWELVDKSKFKDMPFFGKSTIGHIGLQHHGEEVWYRNIRIRKL